MSESTKKLRLHFESKAQFQAFRSALVRPSFGDESEHGAFLFAAPAGDETLKIVDVAVLNLADFVVQSARHLELKDDVLQRMIVRAHKTNTALVEAHSHPLTKGPGVRFSSLDCEGLADLGPHVAWRLPGRPYAALVFGQDAFDSLYWEGRERWPQGSVDLIVAGQLLRASRESERAWGKPKVDRFDRQRMIFGDEGQKRLHNTTVGIVGGGGLGSFMVLELAYLGIGKIVIIDKDLLEDPNRNRTVGAWESHPEGTPKVDLLRDLVSLIDSEIEIEAVQAWVEEPEAKAALADVDIVVGCLDHDGPRFVLNKFCCKQGLPLVDAASDTIPEEDRVLFGGRVCVATSATGCLMCFGVLNQDEIRDYFASPEQLADQREIYGVPERALAGGGPSVITVNGVVASIAATELMVLVTKVRAPIAHQDWHGHTGRLNRVVDYEEDCYYCGLRPTGEPKALVGTSC